MNDDLTRHRGGGELHQGADHSAPYPVSRLAPSIELVDLAQQIQHADDVVTTRVSAKLQVIADQVKALQAEARVILEAARKDQELHRARCSFKRIPGKTYHLYRRGNGQTEFSMLAPEDWGARCPHEFIGSYRLEADMSWTPAAEIGQRGDDTRETVSRLLGKPVEL